MEKVWDELKKIEAQAEQIRNEAQNKAKTLVDLSLQEVEKLVANSKTYAEEEAQRLQINTIEETNHNYEEQLKSNKQTIDEVKKDAGEKMEQATAIIVKAVLGETKI